MLPGVMFVLRFVFVIHAVQVEEVGDLALLETLDLVTLQGADFVLADVVPVLAPVA